MKSRQVPKTDERLCYIIVNDLLCILGDNYLPYSMSKMNRNVSNWKMIFHQKLQDSKTKNGESNGLDLLLHAEQFNYAFYKTHGAGFKLALHDHRDKAFMQFSAKLIQMGSETQINIKPSIVYTSKDAIKKFDSHERGCYDEGEANMTYLDYHHGFRYEMNNCLIDEGIKDIIWNCRCLPHFFEGHDLSLRLDDYSIPAHFSILGV